MTSFRKITVRGATVVALVAMLAASVAPAKAGSNFGFSFSFGNGGYSQQRPYNPRPRFCQNTQQIASGLRNLGYTNVQFTGEPYAGYPDFQATYGNWIYKLQVNRCTGQIYSANRIRPVYYQPSPPPVYPWWYYNQPRPYGGNSDYIYHRN